MPVGIICVYWIVMNGIGLISMKRDKDKARRHQWRTRERTLFLIAVFGGSIGCLIGMYAFRHKTRQPSFVFGMPLILVLQIAALVWLSFQTEILNR